MVVKLVCVVEIDGARNVADAETILDTFRECATAIELPHGTVTIYRADEATADTAIYAAAAAVLDSADNEGCSDDWTVVSQEAIDVLQKALHSDARR